jgi:hypothetical protein
MLSIREPSQLRSTLQISPKDIHNSVIYTAVARFNPIGAGMCVVTDVKADWLNPYSSATSFVGNVPSPSKG